MGLINRGSLLTGGLGHSLAEILTIVFSKLVRNPVCSAHRAPRPNSSCSKLSVDPTSLLSPRGATTLSHALVRQLSLACCTGSQGGRANEKYLESAKRYGSYICRRRVNLSSAPLSSRRVSPTVAK